MNSPMMEDNGSAVRCRPARYIATCWRSFFCFAITGAIAGAFLVCEWFVVTWGPVCRIGLGAEFIAISFLFCTLLVSLLLLGDWRCSLRGAVMCCCNQSWHLYAWWTTFPSLLILVWGAVLTLQACRIQRRMGVAAIAAVVTYVLIRYLRWAWAMGKCRRRAWTKHMVRYLDAAHSFNTGDIVLASEGGTLGKMIMFMTSCKYSHVALVVRDPPNFVLQTYDIPDDRKDPFDVYILEANAKPVSLRPMCEVVTLRYGRLAVRKITARQKNTDAFFDWMRDIGPAPYNWGGLICALCRCTTSDTSRAFFCSELVLRGLQKLEVVEDYVVGGNFAPLHFTLPKSTMPYCEHVKLEDTVGVKDIYQDFDPERLSELLKTFVTPVGDPLSDRRAFFEKYLQLLHDNNWNDYVQNLAIESRQVYRLYLPDDPWAPENYAARRKKKNRVTQAITPDAQSTVACQ